MQTEQNIISEKLSELNELPDHFHFDHELTWKRLDMRLVSEGQGKEAGLIDSFHLLIIRLLHSITALFGAGDQGSVNRRRNRKRMGQRSLRSLRVWKDRR